MTSSELKRLLRTLSARMLVRVVEAGDHAPSEPIEIIIGEEGGLRLVVSLSHGKCPVAKLIQLSDLHRAILGAVTANPTPIKTIAKKAGYALSSHFREAVRELVDRGEILRVTGGIRTAPAK